MRIRGNMKRNDGRCLIIAEAGVNHNGNLDLALKLCDAAKAAGADVVKFQTWKTEALSSKATVSKWARSRRACKSACLNRPLYQII